MIRAEPFREAARRGEGLSVRELLHLHGRATVPALLLVMAVLSAAPVAGIGAAMTLPLLLIALHWPGRSPRRRSPLPERLLEFRLSETSARRCLQLFAGLYDTARARLQRRWTALRHPASTWAWRLWIALMALVILLPLPLGNVLPGLSLVLLALGWVYKDGLALVLALFSGTAGLAYVGLSAQLLLSLMQGLGAA